MNIKITGSLSWYPADIQKHLEAQKDVTHHICACFPLNRCISRRFVLWLETKCPGWILPGRYILGDAAIIAETSQMEAKTCHRVEQQRGLVLRATMQDTQRNDAAHLG